MTRTAMFWKVT